VILGGRTHTAGTAEIARQSGGDSNSIDDAGSVEETLQRIRQRYALYFYLPQDAKAGQERNIEVTLASGARQQYQGAEVRYRQRYLAPGAGSQTDTTDAEPVLSQVPSSPSSDQPTATSGSNDPEAGSGLHRRRRPAVDDTGGSRGPMTEPSGGWKRAPGEDASSPSATTPSATSAPQGDTSASPGSAASQTERGGWKRSDSAPAATPPTPGTTTTTTTPTPSGKPASKDAPTNATTQDQPASTTGDQQQKGGWRRVKPGEQP